MKKFSTFIISLLTLALFVSCVPSANVKNADLKNKWVDDDDTLPITYTFSDNKNGDIQLYFDLFGTDCYISGTFTTPAQGKLHFSFTEAKLGDTTKTMAELESFAALFGITLPVQQEMDFNYSISLKLLTLIQTKTDAEGIETETDNVRNCTLAFTEKDLIGSWKKQYHHYTGPLASTEEYNRTYTFNSDKTGKYTYDDVVINGTWSLKNNELVFTVTGGTKNGEAIASEDLSSYNNNIGFNNNKIAINQNVFYVYNSSTAVDSFYLKTDSKELENISKTNLVGKWRTSERTSLLSETINYYYSFSKKNNVVEWRENDVSYKGTYSINNGNLSITDTRKFNSENNTWQSYSVDYNYTVKHSKSYLTLTDSEKTLHFVRQ